MMLLFRLKTLCDKDKTSKSLLRDRSASPDRCILYIIIKRINGGKFAAASICIIVIESCTLSYITKRAL